MLWVAFDIELCDDPAWLELEDIDPRAMSRLVRLAQIAKRNDPSGGRLCRRDGGPMCALDLARVHERSADAAAAWERFLSEAIRLGFLCELDGCLALVDWDTRWGKKPSDESGAVAERKRLQRERDRLAKERAEIEALKASLQGPLNDVTPCHAPVTPPTVTPVTPCHGRHAAQHSTAQHEHSSTPPSPPPGGAGAGSGQENEGDEGEPKVVSDCLSAAQALHGQALPAKAERKVRDEVEALLQAGHPPDAIGAWCRQACEDLLRDPAGLNVPVYGIPRRMRQFSTAPPADAPALAGGAKPSRHPARCRCPVCGVVEDIVRWSLDQPDIANLEAGCRHFASKRFLPGLSGDQVLEGIIEALRLVDDVQPHVRSACRSLAERLGATKSFSASPDPGWSTPAEALLAEFESLPESEQADLLAIAWETMPAVARSLVSEGDRTDSGHPMVRGALLEVLGDRARASPVPA